MWLYVLPLTESQIRNSNRSEYKCAADGYRFLLYRKWKKRSGKGLLKRSNVYFACMNGMNQEFSPYWFVNNSIPWNVHMNQFQRYSWRCCLKHSGLFLFLFFFNKNMIAINWADSCTTLLVTLLLGFLSAPRPGKSSSGQRDSHHIAPLLGLTAVHFLDH